MLDSLWWIIGFLAFDAAVAAGVIWLMHWWGERELTKMRDEFAAHDHKDRPHE